MRKYSFEFKKKSFLFIDCFQCSIKVPALVLRECNPLATALVVRMPLSDVQLDGIAVPRNEVCFLCVAFAIFSEDGFVLAAVSFTANHSKAAACHFRVTKKRRIATTLLSCSEDGARERYSIICCTFSFC